MPGESLGPVARLRSTRFLTCIIIELTPQCGAVISTIKHLVHIGVCSLREAVYSQFYIYGDSY